MNSKRIFIISSVREADENYRKKLEDYARKLEEEGNLVYLPHRDTDQRAVSIIICKENQSAIVLADEVHVFYLPTSQGVHFDLGMAFALNKKIEVVESIPYKEGKSFPRMLDEWMEIQKRW